VRDILDVLQDWTRDGVRFAVATVVRTWSSAPRPIGASMAVSEQGEVIGSVSGGCVEGAVYEVATEVLNTGVPQLVRYGVANESAYAVGLTCGGTIELFVSRADETLASYISELSADVLARRPVALATVVAAPEEGGYVGRRMLIRPDGVDGSIGNGDLDHAVRDDGRGRLASGETGALQLGVDGQRRMDDVTVFVESYAPPPRMIVFGAIDFASAVARVGKFLGYYVTVCDARALFATPARFPDADEVVVAWPHKYLDEVDLDERTVLCVLTHDPKFDVPLLVKALRRPARYVGAMGSRRTHADRLAKLRAEGMTDSELARLRSPIGLDLGARTPEETAISIASEIVAVTWGGTGAPLTSLSAPIHRESLATEAGAAPA